MTDRTAGPATVVLLTQGADAAEALAAGVPRALERLVATAGALDDALGAEAGAGTAPAASRLWMDELGDLLVSLSAAGLDADERSRLALRLAAGLRAVRAGL